MNNRSNQLIPILTLYTNHIYNQNVSKNCKFILQNIMNHQRKYQILTEKDMNNKSNHLYPTLTLYTNNPFITSDVDSVNYSLALLARSPFSMISPIGNQQTNSPTNQYINR